MVGLCCIRYLQHSSASPNTLSMALAIKYQKNSLSFWGKLRGDIIGWAPAIVLLELWPKTNKRTAIVMLAHAHRPNKQFRDQNKPRETQQKNKNHNNNKDRMKKKTKMQARLKTICVCLLVDLVSLLANWLNSMSLLSWLGWLVSLSGSPLMLLSTDVLFMLTSHIAIRFFALLLFLPNHFVRRLFVSDLLLEEMKTPSWIIRFWI